MKACRRARYIAAAITLGSSVSAFAAEKDVVDTAMEAGQFKTLGAALEAAGLVVTLKETGPFKVFAPTMRPLPGCRPVPSRAC